MYKKTVISTKIIVIIYIPANKKPTEIGEPK